MKRKKFFVGMLVCVSFLLACSSTKKVAQTTEPSQSKDRAIASENSGIVYKGVLKAAVRYLYSKSLEAVGSTPFPGTHSADNARSYSCPPVRWAAPLTPTANKGEFAGVMEVECVVRPSEGEGSFVKLNEFILHRVSTEGTVDAGPIIGKYRDLPSTLYTVTIPLDVEVGSLKLQEDVYVATNGTDTLYASHYSKQIIGEGIIVFLKTMNNSLDAIKEPSGYHFKFRSEIALVKPSYFPSKALFVDGAHKVMEHNFNMQLADLIPILQRNL